METFKPTIHLRGKAAFLAIACLLVPVYADEIRGSEAKADRELSRRSAAIQEAQELLRKGDESYTAAKYAEAIEAYAGARDLLPDAPITKSLRDAATERYAQASVEQAKYLSRKGDVEGAQLIVSKVLAPNVSPDHPGATLYLAQLNDPIRTNPALTAEHAKNIDEVRRLLYTAEGAYNLGKFDEAQRVYHSILVIDPTNTAARRGLETVSSAKSGYLKSASDQARSEMLSEVDRQWELNVPVPVIDPALVQTDNPGNDVSSISVKNKLDRIIIPMLAFDQASLQEALEVLRIKASENDTFELDPARKGINFAVNLGPSDSAEAKEISNIRFDLQISQVPLSQALKYITDITKTSYRTDDFSVIIAPASSSSTELLSRSYRVPPDFISSLSNGAAADAPSDDPFAAGSSNTGGLLVKRLGAKEALAKQGVQFPEGSSANYIPASNTLQVINTQLNQDYISQIIESITKMEPLMVMVRVTMIKVEQTRLEELGFDWILDNFGFGGNGASPGASKLNLSGGTQGNGSEVSDLELPAGNTISRPITAGNRSGDGAIDNNRIDGLFNNPGGRQSNNRAPGVFGVHGELSNASVQTLMRGLDQKKGVDFLAQPSVPTRSGQSSSIGIVREFIYPTEYEPPELPNISAPTTFIITSPFGTGFKTPNSRAVIPATPTAFETKDVGVTLEVLPVVDADKKYINVTLNPTFSDFDGFVNYGSPINAIENGLFGPEALELTANAILMPVFSRQTVTTSVDVADGGTVVLGGLLQESTQNIEDKTPILGSLPIIGRLFQSKVNKSIKTAIIFLVNVELMDPTGNRYRDR